MHVSKEFLTEAVGLALLVALLMLGFQMFTRAETLLQRLDREEEKRIEELSEYEIVKYDGREIDGITAISHIKNVVSNYGIQVVLYTEKGSVIVEGAEQLSLLREENSDYYVEAWGIYACNIVRNENDSIEQMIIRRRGEEE